MILSVDDSLMPEYLNLSIAEFECVFLFPSCENCAPSSLEVKRMSFSAGRGTGMSIVSLSIGDSLPELVLLFKREVLGIDSKFLVLP